MRKDRSATGVNQLAYGVLAYWHKARNGPLKYLLNTRQTRVTTVNIQWLTQHCHKRKTPSSYELGVCIWRKDRDSNSGTVARRRFKTLSLGYSNINQLVAFQFSLLETHSQMYVVGPILLHMDSLCVAPVISLQDASRPAKSIF